MVAKNLDGVMPAAGQSDGAIALAESMAALTDAYFAAMNALQLHRALEAVMTMVSAANGFFAEAAPWKLAKTDVGAMANVLAVTLDATRRIVLLVQPFMPASSAALLDQLGVADEVRDFSDMDAIVAPGTLLPAPQGVFPRWAEPQ